MRRLSLTCGALLLALSLPLPVWGDDAAKAAKIRTAAQEFDAGRRAYIEKDYESAAIHFENADRDAPSMEALRLAIRARQEGGFASRAATLSQQALKRYPADEATVSLARSVIEQFGSGLFKLQVQCSPACGLLIDDKVMFEEQSTDQIVWLPPGRHSVAASWTERRGRALVVEGQAGREQILVLNPLQSAEPQSSATPLVPISAASSEQRPVATSSGLPPAVFFVGAGLTAVLAGVTIWSGIDTRNHPGKATVESACVNLGEDCPEYQEGLANQRRTNILLGTTIGVGVLTGVAALFTRWGEAQSTSRVGLTLQPSIGWRDGFQAGAVGRF